MENIRGNMKRFTITPFSLLTKLTDVEFISHKDLIKVGIR